MLEKIKDDMKDAMKAGDKLKVSTLRMMISEIKNLQIEKGGVNVELEEADILTLIQRGVKKRNEAAKSFRDGERTEMAEKEEAEAKILQAYLPEALTGEELEKAVEEAIASTDAQTKRDMGKVMGFVMGKYRGRVDGKSVQAIVMAKLP